MPHYQEKVKLLKKLNEQEFRVEVLVPLLRRLGNERVRERHGPGEYGKDITFIEVRPLGNNYHAIVAKVGNISGAASGKANLATVMTQVNQAFDIAVDDIEEKRKVPVSHVTVWTTGSISRNAVEQVVNSLSSEYRNVSFKDGEATVELLEEYYPAYFTIGDPYVSDYYTGAKAFHSQIEELRTLGTSSDNLRLPVIFVPPLFRPYAKGSKTSEMPSNLLSLSELISSADDIAIAGQLGSGKSTVLRRILLSVIESNEAQNQRTPIPILIPFKNLDLADPECFARALNGEFSRYSKTPPDEELGTDMVDGSVIALVDGLDELKNEDTILLAIERLEEFKKQFPKVRTILTTRLMELLDNPAIFSGFRILQIEDLNPNQAQDLVKKWFGEGDPVGARLSQLLRDPLTLRGLPSTPMTLALVAILHAGGAKEIPANLTELFSKYVELALGRWDEGKDLSQQFEWRIKEFLLRGIAWKLHVAGSPSIDDTELQDIVHELSRDRGLSIEASLFVDEVSERSELLVATTSDTYEFKHRAFQDFFVGSEINSRADPLEIIVDHFPDNPWQQSIFFRYWSEA